MIGEPDGLYDKYRVFKEPDDVEYHPVPLYQEPTYLPDHQPKNEQWAMSYALEEVEAFVFVLKPDNDHHARVAIAAYAESVREEKPQLASDLRDMLDSFDEVVAQQVDATMNFERLGNGGK